MKKLTLMKLMSAFVCVMLLSSCGGGGDDPAPIPLPNDNFSSYTTGSFPADPWYVFDGSDTTTANWTITNSGGTYAANYLPSSRHLCSPDQ